MKDKRLKHENFSKEERDYWKNLHVNIDEFCDKWDDAFKEDLYKTLQKFSLEEIQSLCKFYSITTGEREKLIKSLLENTKNSIDFYCCIKFSLINPKAISQLFGIEIKSGEVNRPAIFLTILRTHKEAGLIQVFIKLRKQKIGKGNYNFNFNSKLSGKDFKKYQDIMPLLIRSLKRNDKRHKRYHLRFESFSESEWHFLILKETKDVIYPAIPDNTRVLQGDYILVTVKPQENLLEINTQSKLEAYSIREYLSYKVKNRLSYQKIYSNYSPNKFFSEITNEANGTPVFQLTEVEFRDNNLHVPLKIFDAEHKNNISAQLRALKEKDILKLKDFSEFRSITFYYQGISFKIIVEESKWGQLRLNLLDQGKPKKELEVFRQTFEKVYNVPINVHLVSEDSSIDQKKIIRRLLEKSTIDAALPMEAESALLELINLKFLGRPSNTAKRRCINCHKLTWQKGDCPECGNQLVIEGDFIDLKVNINSIHKWIYQLLLDIKTIKVRKIKKQIESTPFNIIDIIDATGRVLSIYVSQSNVPDKIVKHYQETGSPLLIILVKYKDALHKDIEVKGFECIEISDLYLSRDKKDVISSSILKAVEAQAQKWQSKIITKGYNSYLRITNKPKGYTDQDFEKDIYNILHEIFLVGDRLGGKFVGIAAPDGIVSIQNYNLPIKRYCLAWDCKYSTLAEGYQLMDQPDKHRKYINVLKRNDKVLFYGGLSTYAIISQNMNKAKYESFYNKVTDKFRWKGNLLFIEENTLLSLYKYYKENEAIIQNNPSIYYSLVYRLFKSIFSKDSQPYKFISFKRMETFYDDVTAKYKVIGKDFTFNREEFKV